MNSNSEMVRYLLTHFPGLKPKEVERLLGERGVKVDANLIGVARLRHRRNPDEQTRLLRLLAKLYHKRPDLLPAFQATFDEVVQRVVQTAASFHGLPEEDLVEALAASIPRQEPPETPAARAARIFVAVLDRRPEFRHSIAVATGFKPDQIKGVVVQANFPDDATDAELEAVMVRFLEERYPVGPTAEAVARAFLGIVQQRAESQRAEQQQAGRAVQERAARIMNAVLAKVRAPVSDPDAAVAVIEHFMSEFAGWDDADIVERIAEGLELQAGREERDDRHIEGLTIRPHL
jgi:hypothetical protein